MAAGDPVPPSAKMKERDLFFFKHSVARAPGLVLKKIMQISTKNQAEQAAGYSPTLPGSLLVEVLILSGRIRISKINKYDSTIVREMISDFTLKNPTLRGLYIGSHTVCISAFSKGHPCCVFVCVACGSSSNTTFEAAGS